MLRDVVSGRLNSIRPALELAAKLDTHIQERVADTLATIENSDDDQKQRHRVHMEVMLLIYMGINISKQLKVLCATTARAFLPWNEEAIALANALMAASVNRASTLTPEQSLEYFMAQLLDTGTTPAALVNDSLEEVRIDRASLSI